MKWFQKTSKQSTENGDVAYRRQNDLRSHSLILSFSIPVVGQFQIIINRSEFDTMVEMMRPIALEDEFEWPLQKEKAQLERRLINESRQLESLQKEKAQLEQRLLTAEKMRQTILAAVRQ